MARIADFGGTLSGLLDDFVDALVAAITEDAARRAPPVRVRERPAPAPPRRKKARASRAPAPSRPPRESEAPRSRRSSAPPLATEISDPESLLSTVLAAAGRSRPPRPADTAVEPVLPALLRDATPPPPPDPPPPPVVVATPVLRPDEVAQRTRSGTVVIRRTRS